MEDWGSSWLISSWGTRFTAESAEGAEKEMVRF